MYELFERAIDVFEFVTSVTERAPVAMLMLVRDKKDCGLERKESAREGAGEGKGDERDP